MQLMLDAGVSTRRAIMCSHREGAYADAPFRQALTHSEHAQDHCLLLPLHPHLTPEEHEQVASELHAACVAQLRVVLS